MTGYLLCALLELKLVLGLTKIVPTLIIKVLTLVKNYLAFDYL